MHLHECTVLSSHMTVKDHTAHKNDTLKPEVQGPDKTVTLIRFVLKYINTFMLKNILKILVWINENLHYLGIKHVMKKYFSFNYIEHFSFT